MAFVIDSSSLPKIPLTTTGGTPTELKMKPINVALQLANGDAVSFELPVHTVLINGRMNLAVVDNPGGVPTGVVGFRSRFVQVVHSAVYNNINGIAGDVLSNFSSGANFNGVDHGITIGFFDGIVLTGANGNAGQVNVSLDVQVGPNAVVWSINNRKTQDVFVNLFMYASFVG